MFLKYFNLQQQPFGVTPDSRFLFLSESHREALASLFYGIEENRGFVTLIAPPGMGKTTLLFRIMEQLRDTASTAFLFQTQCNSQEFLRYLLADMKIECSKDDVVEMHEKLNYALLRIRQAGSRFVVVIDEAQNLDDSVLETIRLLSDFETQSAKLMQIILAGQPQLAQKLASPKLTQLRQRISIWARLTPFSAEETSAYIDHRLAVAGSSDHSLFTREARNLIASYSGGIPRNINAICFNALSVSCALGQKRVDSTAVREVASDLAFPDEQPAVSNSAPLPESRTPRVESPVPRTSRPRPTTMQLVVLSGLGIGAGLLWSPIVRLGSAWTKNNSSSVVSNAGSPANHAPAAIQASLLGVQQAHPPQVLEDTSTGLTSSEDSSKALSVKPSATGSHLFRPKVESARNDLPRTGHDNSASEHVRNAGSPLTEKKDRSRAKKEVQTGYFAEAGNPVGSKMGERVRPKHSRDIASTDRGAILFVTDPPGMEVVIDSNSYGPSPVRALLPAGMHTYRIEASKTTKPMSGEFDLPASTVRVETVRLESEPQLASGQGNDQAVEKPPHELH